MYFLSMLEVCMTKIFMAVFICFIALSSTDTYVAAKGKFVQYGECSFYASSLHGKETASQTIFSNNKLLGAHRDLPMGVWVRVTNKKNKRSVDVKVVDRGPYIPGRIIDLSQKAFSQIASQKDGVVDVKLETL